MSSSLPVELLRLILDNFACPPISNDGTLVNTHRHELLALCLTSKIFRQIAQPLLFQVVSLNASDAGDRLQRFLATSQSGGALSGVRTLKTKGYNRKSLLANLVSACLLLEQMICNHCVIELDMFHSSSE